MINKPDRKTSYFQFRLFLILFFCPLGNQRFSSDILPDLKEEKKTLDILISCRSLDD